MQILLEDYAQCRDDERTWSVVFVTLFTATVALVGLLAAAVTQTCAFTAPGKSCVAVPDYILGGAPLLPVAALTMAQMSATVATVRNFYLRGIEEELRGDSPEPFRSLGGLTPASYVSVMTELTSMRRGRIAYRLLAQLMLSTQFLVFGGLATYIGLHVGPVVQAGMTLLYGPTVVLLSYEAYRAGPSGRSMFAKAVRDYLAHRDTRGYALSDIGMRPQRRPGERSLVSYLLMPRVAEWVKWLITPGVFGTAAWAAASFRGWPRLLAVWLILEYLIYEARYQWNDVRGIHEDTKHPVSAARRRLPAGAHARRNILASCLAAALRLMAALAGGAAIHLLGTVAVLIGLVFGTAIGYEALRAGTKSRRPPSRTAARSVAIWLVVGSGYAIRSGAGLWLAGFRISSIAAVSGMLYFAVFGIMFVLLGWVLEAASYCRSDGNETLYPTRALAAKPHIAILLRWTAWKTGNGTGNSSGAAERVLAKKRAKQYAPWNVALALGAGLGAVAGMALARPDSPPAGYGIAAALGVLGAALLMTLTRALACLAVTVTVGAALTGLTLPDVHSPVAIIAAIPWIVIAADYVFLCQSSYQDLMSFGPSLASGLGAAARTLPPLLLRVVIGRRSWQYAGFGRRSAR
ncbi:MAG: hypothetical protein JOY82_01910 [Streptosporangiaceae bacterium]|nr:hypothetical protein [Streptosporangiaceae bacterium]MBV9853267.1 hypothetical protein [Streptosporangiaceae bacterium]